MTAYTLAQRYVGQVIERSGDAEHPLIQWWLSLCGYGLDAKDEIPWCSAFVNGIAWELRLPRSKSAAARSWLNIGKPYTLSTAEVGFDVIVLNRGGSPDPLASGPGHVGWYAGMASESHVRVLGGNQGNAISIAVFPIDQVLGVRRLDNAFSGVNYT